MAFPCRYDAFRGVFSHVNDWRTLCRAGLVCRAWHLISKDPLCAVGVLTTQEHTRTEHDLRTMLGTDNSCPVAPEERVMQLLLAASEKRVGLSSRALRDALDRAIRLGYCRVITTLVEQGADLSAVDRQGNSSLYTAAYSGRSEVVETVLAALPKGGLLLSSYIAVHGPSVLAMVVSRLSFEGDWHAIVSLLLENGVSINKEALWGAVEVGDTHIIHLLLNALRGATSRLCNAKNSMGRSSLHIAVLNAHTSAVEALLAANADLSAQDNDGLTPLHLAVACGYEVIVKILLEHDAPIHLLSKSGWTPLHMAAARGRDEIVAALLGKSPDLNAQDVEGHSSLGLAVERNDEPVVRRLLAAGADPHILGSLEECSLVPEILFLLLRASGAPSGTVTFRRDWEVEIKGDLLPGGILSVEWDRLALFVSQPERHAAKRPVLDVVANVQFFPGGQHSTGSVLRRVFREGATVSDDPTPVPFQVRVPVDAERVEIWFKCCCATRSIAEDFDSSFGHNYTFTLEPRATLHFRKDWRVVCSRDAVAGGLLLLEYDLERLGSPRGGDISAHVHFHPGGQRYVEPVTVLEGSHTIGFVHPIRIPQDANRMEVWFDRWHKTTGSVEYDSNLGHNYEFHIASATGDLHDWGPHWPLSSEDEGDRETVLWFHRGGHRGVEQDEDLMVGRPLRINYMNNEESHTAWIWFLPEGGCVKGCVHHQQLPSHLQGFLTRVPRGATSAHVWFTTNVILGPEGHMPHPTVLFDRNFGKYYVLHVTPRPTDAYHMLVAPTPSVLHFYSDWSHEQRGILYPGGRLRIHYDLERLSRDASYTSYTGPLFEATVHVCFTRRRHDRLEIRKKMVRIKGLPGSHERLRLLCQPVEVQIPSDGIQCEVWFSLWPCGPFPPGQVQYDSFFGKNYRFDILCLDVRRGSSEELLLRSESDSDSTRSGGDES